MCSRRLAWWRSQRRYWMDLGENYVVRGLSEIAKGFANVLSQVDGIRNGAGGRAWHVYGISKVVRCICSA